MILLLILERSIAGRDDHEQDQIMSMTSGFAAYNPHLARASAKLDRALSKLARYLSTAGAANHAGQDFPARRAARKWR